MSSRSFSNGNGPGSGCSNLNGSSPGAGSHPGVIAVGPSFQGQPWADGHWWWLS
jgi:hypothetical protein